MKFFLLFFVFLFTTSLMSYNKKTVKTTLRSAAEEIITKSGFSLLSQDIQDEALKEQASQTKDECIDDTCLMDTGKMLSAQRLFLVRVSDLGNKNFMFKISHINLETNESISVRSEIYSGDLSDSSKLFKFSKKFLSAISKDLKKKKLKNIPAMLEILFEAKAEESGDKKYFILFHLKRKATLLQKEKLNLLEI